MAYWSDKIKKKSCNSNNLIYSVFASNEWSKLFWKKHKHKQKEIFIWKLKV